MTLVVCDVNCQAVSELVTLVVSGLNNQAGGDTCGM